MRLVADASSGKPSVCAFPTCALVNGIHPAGGNGKKPLNQSENLRSAGGHARVQLERADPPGLGWPRGVPERGGPPRTRRPGSQLRPVCVGSRCGRGPSAVRGARMCPCGTPFFWNGSGSDTRSSESRWRIAVDGMFQLFSRLAHRTMPRIQTRQQLLGSGKSGAGLLLSHRLA